MATQTAAQSGGRGRGLLNRATDFVQRRFNPVEAYDNTVRFLKRKFAAVDIFDETLAEKVDLNPWYALGSMVYLFWLITIVSGLILIIWYIPNTARAYESIYRFQEGVPLGWLMRGLHKYGADAVIIAATLRVYRLYFTGEYKKMELAWVISIITLIIGMFSGLTGYLLIWNQRAFWASKVFATFPTYIDQIPIIAQTNIGMTTAQFMLGGSAIGEATLTRFYAGHFALSMLSLIVVEAYFLRKGYRRINLSWTGIGVCFLMLILATIMVRPESGSQANRAETPLPILSDWYFLGLYQMMKEMKPLYAVIGTMFIPLIALLMPAFDKAKDVPTWKRPFYLMVGISALLYWLIMSIMIIMDYAQITIDPPLLWGSYSLFLFIGAAFEFKALGFPRPAVQKRLIITVAVWFILVGTFWFWTRFRLPEYSMAYLPLPTAIEVADSLEAQKAHNSQYPRDDLRSALSDPLVTRWLVPSEDQQQVLASANGTVRQGWIMMTLILLLCVGYVWMTTPPNGIESEIYPSRTPIGRKIKGLPPEERPAVGGARARSA